MSIGSTTTLIIDRLVTPVSGMHHAITRRGFAMAGPLGAPIRPIHDAVVDAVYDSIRIAGALAGVGIDRAVTAPPAIADRTQAIVNGLWGDQLGRHGKRLEIPMDIHDRTSEPIDIDHFAEAFPEAGGHVVFLLHGFADTERCWLQTGAALGLFETLQAHAGFTPVLVRYNTGRSIADNGASLAELLDCCHSRWPVPVTTMSLVGHSMGGLVIREACVSGQTAGHDWVSKVSHVVTVASPHLGTPIEKLVHGLAKGLGVARETMPLQDFVDTRSRGIKDLRAGVPLEPLPAGIAHHSVAGVFTSDTAHPMGALLGDLVVRVPSASAGPGVDSSDTMVVAGMRHNDLVHHEPVIDRIVQWLETAKTGR